MTQAQMKVGQFSLTLRAADPIILPTYKGSTLRGGFGNAFKKVVCALKDKECADCMLRERCVYAYVFETPPPAGSRVMRKYLAVPRPFVIEPPAERRNGYKPGEELTFGLTLIGKAVDYLPYFVYAFDELGNIGIGRGHGKYGGKYELMAVDRKEHAGQPAPSPHAGGRADPPSGNGRRIYAAQTKRLEPFTPETLPIDIRPRDLGPPAILTLTFLTPTRIYHDDHLAHGLEFHVLVRHLLRRISMLAYFHCDIDTTGWDFKGCIERAGQISTRTSRLNWYAWQRYSARQDKKIDMDGFVGQVAYAGDLAPFLPLIRAGEALHVGKGTTFGLGRYEMQIQ